jgi:hypothetical protein
VDVGIGNVGHGASGEAIARSVDDAHQRLSAVAFLGEPDLWLGVAVAALLLVVVMRARRLRGET